MGKTLRKFSKKGKKTQQRRKTKGRKPIRRKSVRRGKRGGGKCENECNVVQHPSTTLVKVAPTSIKEGIPEAFQRFTDGKTKKITSCLACIEPKERKQFLIKWIPNYDKNDHNTNLGYFQQIYNIALEAQEAIQKRETAEFNETQAKLRAKEDEQIAQDAQRAREEIADGVPPNIQNAKLDKNKKINQKMKENCENTFPNNSKPGFFGSSKDTNEEIRKDCEKLTNNLVAYKDIDNKNYEFQINPIKKQKLEEFFTTELEKQGKNDEDVMMKTSNIFKSINDAIESK